jgi:hypothetical protein
MLPGIGEIRYDWDGVSRLIAEFGDDFDKTISDAGTRMDLESIAKALAIGSGKDVSEVKAVSPPIVKAIEAVMLALNIAFYGQEGAPAANADENPSKAKKATAKKSSAKRKRPRPA